ncbi:MAG: peptide ABC transporter permease, partial [Janthinobacterium lividum]
MKRRALAPALGAAVTAPPVAGRSPWQDARTRFVRNKAAVASLVLLVLITLICIIGPFVLPNDFETSDWSAINTPPTWMNWHLF